MDILIVIGVAAMFAAMCVMYREWRVEKRNHLGVLSELQNTQRARDAVREENERLRNDLHAAINARKAKSRGITGKYRKAIEAHKAAFEGARDGTPTQPIDTALWSVLDSEAV